MTFDRIHLPNRQANLLSRPFQSISSTRRGFKLNVTKNSTKIQGRDAAAAPEKKFAANEQLLLPKNLATKTRWKKKLLITSASWIAVTQWIPLNGLHWRHSIGRRLTERPPIHGRSEMISVKCIDKMVVLISIELIQLTEKTSVFMRLKLHEFMKFIEREMGGDTA